MKQKEKKSVEPGDSKEEIERLYRMAYCVDPGFLRPQDVVDLGIDVVLLKEFGQVRMKKTVAVLKRHVNKLWARMSTEQKAAYILSDILSGLAFLADALSALEGYMGPLPGVQEEVDMAYNALFTRIPRPLWQKLEKGFGKWKSK